MGRGGFCGCLVKRSLTIRARRGGWRGGFFGEDIDDGVFDGGEMGLMGDHILHALGIFSLGALGARGPDGGSAAEVQGFCLERGCIRIFAHFAAEGIDFVDEVAFCESTDGRVTGHTGNGVRTGRHEDGFEAHPCRGEGCFCARMAATDDDDVGSSIYLHDPYIIPYYRLVCEQKFCSYYASC